MSQQARKKLNQVCRGMVGEGRGNGELSLPQAEKMPGVECPPDRCEEDDSFGRHCICLFECASPITPGALETLSVLFGKRS